MNRKQKPIWGVYNGLLMEWRQEGDTLQQIGDRVNRSRERIRQLLEEHYETTEISGFISRARLSEIIGCSSLRLKRLEEQGLLNPFRRGYHHLYNKDEAERAVLVLQKFCKQCGKVIPLESLARVRCSDCSLEFRRNHYPFMTAEAKAQHYKLVMRWKKEHPEAYKVIQQRAQAKYEKKRAEDKELDRLEVFE